MRDINEYQVAYQASDFEPYMAYFRKKKILQIIGQYPHKKILEIGCGMDPFFNYVDFDEYVFYEPANDFYNNAIKMSGGGIEKQDNRAQRAIFCKVSKK